MVGLAPEGRTRGEGEALRLREKGEERKREARDGLVVGCCMRLKEALRPVSGCPQSI